MEKTTYIYQNIGENYQLCQKAVSEDTITTAVIKANAYGCGRFASFLALYKAGCRVFFVGFANEFMLLIKAASHYDGDDGLIDMDLYEMIMECKFFALYHNYQILQDAMQDWLQWLKTDTAPGHYKNGNVIDMNALDIPLIPVINNRYEWDDMSAFSYFLYEHYGLTKPLPVALHIDTGMRRYGIPIDEWEELYNEEQNNLHITLVMSHLACADTPNHPHNEMQLEKFRTIRRKALDASKRQGEKMHKPIFSLANSAGILLGPAYHFDMVRPGATLYGVDVFYGPQMPTAHQPAKPKPLPVLYMFTPILQIQKLEKGESVGYGSNFTADKDMEIATIALGYADGISRLWDQDGVVYIHDKACKILGRISMDLLTIDVTGLKEYMLKNDDSYPFGIGYPVEIVGNHQQVHHLAHAIGTIGYELLLHLGNRVTIS